jgi:hypothetical protein
MTLPMLKRSLRLSYVEEDLLRVVLNAVKAARKKQQHVYASTTRKHETRVFREANTSDAKAKGKNF